KMLFKRVFDLIVSVFLMIPLIFIFLIISILIKLDSKGNILFKQERLGKNGKIFKIYKFRTMVKNAESIGTGIYTSDDDPRITRIGNYLRKTSLDELPQIINIIKGDMSFVGPRPPVPYHPYRIDEYSADKIRRFDVRPGITGMAQAYGRNTLTWDERIVYDVKYADNISFMMDMKIIYKTF